MHDESAGTEECFSEAQLKAMAGVFQGLLDKALTDRAKGGTTSKREDENAERDPPGEMVQGGAGRYWRRSAGPRQEIYIYIPNKCQVRGAGGRKGPQDSPQVPVRERAELGST